MKNIFLIITIQLFSSQIFAQLKTTVSCPPIEVDVLAGTVNELLPKSAIVEIQNTLPCFTTFQVKDTDSTCGGVFYSDRSINFYTDRRYIEIGEKFKGKITPALMGAKRSDLFSILGYPKLKDVHWDAFQMGYGTLILYYNSAGKINKIQMANRSTDAIKLCE